MWPKTAKAGEHIKVVIVVPETCTGSPTTEIRVDIPPEVEMARPQLKPGWTVELTFESISPQEVDAGYTKSRVSAITWKGGPPVPEGYFEEFAFVIRAPTAAGSVYFPATQTCEKGERMWDETPSTQSAHEHSGMEYPAPVLNVE